MGKVEKIIALINRACIFIGSVSLLLMMLIGFANVASRCFWRPIKGSFEVIGFLGAITTAMALGYTQTRKNHVAIDILTNHYRAQWRRRAKTFSYFISALFFAMASWQTTIWGMNIWQSGEKSETLRISYYPFIFIVAFGLGLLAVVLLLDVFQGLQRPEKQEEP